MLPRTFPKSCDTPSLPKLETFDNVVIPDFRDTHPPKCFTTNLHTQNTEIFKENNTKNPHKINELNYFTFGICALLLRPSGIESHRDKKLFMFDTSLFLNFEKKSDFSIERYLFSAVRIFFTP